MSAGVCITSAVALYEVFQWACMNGSAGNLGSAEPRLQRLAVSRLHALLWRPAGWPLAWPDAASQCQQMADKGLLAQLAALVKPGTEAVVLNEVFQLLQRLLDCDDTMARAMLKAGVADALGRGLQEGWLPRGAVDTAAALQAKLQSPAGPKQQQQQQQQQQQLQRRRLPPAPGAGPAAVTAAVRAPSLNLGCGVPWSQLTAQSALVAKRSLHHTKREQEQQRLQLSQLVMQQWLWFTHSGRRQRLAVQHHHRQLMTAGWSALQQEVSQQQLRLCQANLQAAKLSFLQLSRCFVAWQQLLQHKQRLAAAAAGVQARQQRQVLSVALMGWQEVVLQARLQRQLLLRGEAYRVLMVMGRALQAWRGWLADKRLTRLKYSRWGACVCEYDGFNGFEVLRKLSLQQAGLAG
ncbi:hypothetical protein OEZ85_002707 [Tetradesmus obliquus]|uniref:Sfi1 spindle body domain-containing protein n=1 Tax=Tetradesmus obliquus TaxID=3088 RepID=A0ABY8TYW9_TETOB|nr:hypothetical protein OEZ85_002707 [Tetradesmus obliquus]